MKLQEGISVDLTDAQWISGHTLKLSFSDGFSRRLDFEPFLSRSMQPEIREYLDVDKFKAFSISFGNLIWNDYALCFPIEDLYYGSISAVGDFQSMVAEDAPECRTERKGNG